MDQIIRNLASQLGIGTDPAEAGAGAILKLIREQAAAVDFQQLLSAIPDATQWMGRASAVGGEGGGLFGPAAPRIGALAGRPHVAAGRAARGPAPRAGRPSSSALCPAAPPWPRRSPPSAKPASARTRPPGSCRNSS